MSGKSHGVLILTLMASLRRSPSFVEDACSDIPFLLQADEVEVEQQVYYLLFYYFMPSRRVS